jgi:hypothetical protein
MRESKSGGENSLNLFNTFMFRTFRSSIASASLLQALVEAVKGLHLHRSDTGSESTLLKKWEKESVVKFSGSASNIYGGWLHCYYYVYIYYIK